MNTNQTIRLANVKLLAGGQYQTYEDRLSITAVIDDKQKAEVLSQWPDITIKEKDGKNYLKIKCNVAGKFQVPIYDISKTTIFYQNAKDFVDKVAYTRAHVLLSYYVAEYAGKKYPQATLSMAMILNKETFQDINIFDDYISSGDLNIAGEIKTNQKTGLKSVDKIVDIDIFEDDNSLDEELYSKI